MNETRTYVGAKNRQGDNGACYLLFCGSHGPPRGGLGDLVQAFTSERAARQAFHDLRVEGQSHGTWAQLAAVDRDLRIKPLCWFGIGATPRRDPVRGERTRAARSASAPSAAGQRRWVARDWRRRWGARGDGTSPPGAR